MHGMEHGSEHGMHASTVRDQGREGMPQNMNLNVIWHLSTDGEQVA